MWEFVVPPSVGYRIPADGLGGGARGVRPFWRGQPCHNGFSLSGIAVYLILPLGEILRVPGEIQDILLAAHKVNP